MSRRVVVTGLGAHCSLGPNLEVIWPRRFAGQSGEALIQPGDIYFEREYRGQKISDLPARVAFTVPHLMADVAAFLRKVRMKGSMRAVMTKQGAMALMAGYEALCDSKLIVPRGERGFDLLVENPYNFGTRMAVEAPLVRYDDPAWLLKSEPSMQMSLVAMLFGARGDSDANCTACTAGTKSWQDGAMMVKHGYLDVAIVGGGNYAIDARLIHNYAKEGAIARSTGAPDEGRISRPFDKTRKGFVVSAGAGVAVLESLSHALRRKAPIYAEVVGWGGTSDGMLTDPHPKSEGHAEAIRRALKMAKLEPEQINLVNAHGTSTQKNDRAEIRGMTAVFGGHMRNLLIEADKCAIGHLLPASGGIELVFTVMALARGEVPPTINLDDPEFPELDFVANEGRHASPVHALKNSFAFGGHNAVIVLRKWTR